jgi:hypothetical protein
MLNLLDFFLLSEKCTIVAVVSQGSSCLSGNKQPSSQGAVVPHCKELFFADEERCGGLQPNRCES